MWNIQIKTDDNRSRHSKESEKKQPEKQKTINDLYEDFDDTDSLEDFKAPSQQYDECDSSESPWSILSSPRAVRDQSRKQMLDDISEDSDPALTATMDPDSDTNDEDLKLFLQRRQEIDRLLYNSTECVSPEESHGRGRSKSPYSQKSKSRSYSRRSRDRHRRSRTRSPSTRYRRSRSRSGSWSWHSRSRSRSPVPFKRKTPPLEFFEKAIAAAAAASKAGKAKSPEKPRKSIDDVCHAISPTKKRSSTTKKNPPKADTSKKSSVGASLDTEPITPEKVNAKREQNPNLKKTRPGQKKTTSAEKIDSNAVRTPVTRSASKATNVSKEKAITDSNKDFEKKKEFGVASGSKLIADSKQATESKVTESNKITQGLKVQESKQIIEDCEAYDPTEPTGECGVQLGRERDYLVIKSGGMDVSMHVDDAYFEALKKVFQKLNEAECSKPSPQKKNTTDEGQTNVKSEIPSLFNEQDVRYQKMSKDEKLKAFCFFIQYYCKSISNVSLVALALKEFKTDKDMQKEYAVKELTKVVNVSYFCGKLTIGGQFFADAIGCTRREVKSACFAKAVKVCRTCTLEEIKSLHPRSMDELRDQLKGDLESAASDERNAPVNILKRFIHCLKNAKITPTNISGKLYNAAHISKTTNQWSLEFEYSMSKSAEVFCIARCTLAGALIGIAADVKKKTTKDQCLEMAYKRLMLYSAEQLLCGLSSKEMEEGLIKFNSASEEATETLLLRKTKASLNSLIEHIKEHPEETNLMAMLIRKTNELKMAPFCVYKKTGKLNADKIMLISCEMFLNDYLVATGTDTTKNNAKLDAYRKAYAFLKSTTGQNIILNQRKLDPEELNFKNILSYDKQGETTKKDSNIKKLGSDICDGDISELVIMETALLKKNRYVNAFEILNYSCVQNKFLLEWDYTQHGSNYMFHIYIQGKEISSSNITAPTRLRVKSLSSADVLYRLYETNPVLEIVKEYDTNGSFTNTDIEQQAKVMQMSGMDCQELTEEMLMDIPAKMDKKCVKWIYAVMQNMLSIFDNEDTLEEITFGPKCEYYFLFKYFKKKYDIKYSIVKGKKGDFFHVVTPVHTPTAMIKILTNNNGVSGRYQIVEKTSLPKHKDLNEEKNLALKAVSHTDSSMVEKYKKETVELQKDVAMELKKVTVTPALGIPIQTSTRFVQSNPLQTNYSNVSSNAPYAPPYSAPAYSQPYISAPVVPQYTQTPIGPRYPPGPYSQAPALATPGYYNQAPVMTPSPSMQFPPATGPAAPVAHNYQVPPYSYSAPNIPTYRNPTPQHTPVMYTNMAAQALPPVGNRSSKPPTSTIQNDSRRSSSAKVHLARRSKSPVTSSMRISPRKSVPPREKRNYSKSSERRNDSNMKRNNDSPRKRRPGDSPNRRDSSPRRSDCSKRKPGSQRRRSSSPGKNDSLNNRSSSARRFGSSIRSNSPRRSRSPRTGHNDFKRSRREPPERRKGSNFKQKEVSPRRNFNPESSPRGSYRRSPERKHADSAGRDDSNRTNNSRKRSRTPNKQQSNYSPRRSISREIPYGSDRDIITRTLKEGDLRHDLNNRLSGSDSPPRHMNDLSVSLNRLDDKRNVVTTHRDSPRVFDEGPILRYEQLSPDRFDDRLSRDLNSIRTGQYENFSPRERPGRMDEPMPRYIHSPSRDLDDVSPERFLEPSRQLEAISPERPEERFVDVSSRHLNNNFGRESARFVQVLDERFNVPGRPENIHPSSMGDPQRRFQDAPRYNEPPQTFTEPHIFEERRRQLDEHARLNEPPKFHEPPRFDGALRFEEPPRLQEPPRFDGPPRYNDTLRFDEPHTFAESPRRFDDLVFLDRPLESDVNQRFDNRSKESIQRMEDERRSRFDRGRDQRYDDEISMRQIEPHMSGQFGPMEGPPDGPLMFNNGILVNQADTSGVLRVDSRPHEKPFPMRNLPFRGRGIGSRSRSRSNDRHFRNVFTDDSRGSSPGYRERSPNYRDRSPPRHDQEDRFRGKNSPPDFRERPGRY